MESSSCLPFTDTSSHHVLEVAMWPQLTAFGISNHYFSIFWELSWSHCAWLTSPRPGVHLHLASRLVRRIMTSLYHPGTLLKAIPEGSCETFCAQAVFIIFCILSLLHFIKILLFLSSILNVYVVNFVVLQTE